MAEESQNKEQPIVIKKVKKGGHGGHHGGAWKVAYADFVTAMMAFFIVMWILASNEEVKEQVAGYFQDPGIFSYESGRDGSPVDIKIMAAQKKKDGEGNAQGQGQGDEQSASVAPLTISFEKGPHGESDTVSHTAIEKAMARAKLDSAIAQAKMAQMGDDIKKQLAEKLGSQPAMKEILSSINIEMTKEGLRIELIETKDALFFQVGNANLSSKAVEILQLLGKTIMSLPNPVAIEGHTDARQYGKNASYTNWELSNDRANSARRVLTKYMWPGQVESVTGYADRKLRTPNNPFGKTNRRVSIVIKHLSADTFLKNMADVKGNKL